MTATPFTNPAATWNQRYAAENHLFGQEPNDYLRAQAHHLAPGGRVLCVAALGDSVGDAQAHAYAGVAKIHWANEFHRNDIGWRAIARASD